MNETPQAARKGLAAALTPDRRIVVVALVIFALDQITKLMVNHYLPPYEEKIIIPGFFKFVHWGNTGAAWSLFTNRNEILAVVAIVALFGLYFSRHHFESRTPLGQ